MDNINPYILGCAKNRLFVDNSDNTFPWRKVRWYELMLITEGDGSSIILNDNGDKIKAKKGTVVLRNPSMSTKVGTPFSRYIIIFDLNYVKGDENLYSYQKNNKSVFENTKTSKVHDINTDFSGSFITKNFDLYEDLFDTIYQNYVKTDIQNQFVLKTNLMYLIMKIFQEKNSNQKDHLLKHEIVEFDRVDFIKKYIINNLQNDISLQTLSDETNLSREFLCRQFKKVEGKTIVQFINQQRMLKAKYELIETNKTIQEIADICGFQTENYFYKIFKKHENITPNQYRIWGKY